MASEQSMGDILFLRVQMVEDYVGVALMAGREDDDLAEL